MCLATKDLGFVPLKPYVRRVVKRDRFFIRAFFEFLFCVIKKAPAVKYKRLMFRKLRCS